MVVTVHHGDSSEVIRTLADGSIDSCVCDPPYALVSISKRFGKTGRTDSTATKCHPYQRHARGFMGKQWDNGDVAFDPAFWAEVLRVLKPGAHLLAFSGTRTYHRLACAIEDAGFEIRDQIGWLYGSGFPKSHNVGKTLPEWEGWGTALKPAWEPIVLARKPLAGTVATNVLAHGTGALNIDASRVHTDDSKGVAYTVKRLKPGATLDKTGGNWRPEDGPEYHGQTKDGRWPANIIHDGSEEVVAAFPDSDGQLAAVGPQHGPKASVNTYGDYGPRETFNPRGDGGSAARFFYSAKADATDRCGSKHPTVKPVDLMAYLCRLVTPPGGTVLDPFAGSGTTGMACIREGFECVLIEREAEYVADIHKRIAHVSGQDTPLFASAEPIPPLLDVMGAA